MLNYLTGEYLAKYQQLVAANHTLSVLRKLEIINLVTYARMSSKIYNAYQTLSCEEENIWRSS